MAPHNAPTQGRKDISQICGISLLALLLVAITTGRPAAQSLPVLKSTLPGSWEGGWLGSPAVYDLDGDGTQEIIVPRHGVLYVWNGATDSLVWRAAAGKDGVTGPAEGNARIYVAPVVGDLDGQGKGEIAIAWSNKVAIYNYQGKVMPGWPQTVPGGAGEIRSLASADLDGDGKMEIIVGKAGAGPSTMAYTFAGNPFAGWPQAKDCATCIDKGGLTQTLGVADLDGDGVPEVVVPYDTSYVGIFHADGKPSATESNLADTSQGDFFTHSPPAFADLDGDGKLDVILYSTHKRVGDTAILGNCLWVLRHDMQRVKGFEKPLCSDAPIFTRNWNDILETSPSPAIADLDGDGRPEIIVPSNDGNIRAYTSDGSLFWKYKYDSGGEPWIQATEVVIGDLNKDGKPEVVFNTYSVDHFVSSINILDSRGRLQRKGQLDKRGSMAAPTLADVDGDGKIDIIVTLKDVVGGGKGGVQVWTMESAGNTKPLWATGRGGYLRRGVVEGAVAGSIVPVVPVVPVVVVPVVPVIPVSPVVPVDPVPPIVDTVPVVPVVVAPVIPVVDTVPVGPVGPVAVVPGGPDVNGGELTELLQKPVNVVPPLTQPSSEIGSSIRTKDTRPWFDLRGRRIEKPSQNSRLLRVPLR